MRARWWLLLVSFPLTIVQAPMTLAGETKPQQRGSATEFLPWDSPRFSPAERKANLDVRRLITQSVTNGDFYARFNITPLPKGAWKVIAAEVKETDGRGTVTINLDRVVVATINKHGVIHDWELRGSGWKAR